MFAGEGRAPAGGAWKPEGEVMLPDKHRLGGKMDPEMLAREAFESQSKRMNRIQVKSRMVISWGMETSCTENRR